MERWCGRTALVTGASAGIGRAITIRLLNQGLNVVACARRVDAVEEIRNEIDNSNDGTGELIIVKCDVTKEEDILSMFDQIKASKFRGIDVCINNAGVGYCGTLSDGVTSEWQQMLNVNVLGLSVCTREALKSMKSRGVDDGHIINVSSVAAHVVEPPLPFYAATKHAVRALSEGLRQELLAEKSGIRVSCISPGLAKSEFAEIATKSEDAAKQLYEQLNHLTTKDICEATMYALSAPKHVQVHDVIMWPIARPE